MKSLLIAIALLVPSVSFASEYGVITTGFICPVGWTCTPTQSVKTDASTTQQQISYLQSQVNNLYNYYYLQADSNASAWGTDGILDLRINTFLRIETLENQIQGLQNTL